METELTIGALSERTGVATSALRFYEAQGLIDATRTASGQRRYHREMLRRVSFIRIAQMVGLSLDEIHEAMSSLPHGGRTPDEHDWAALSASWRPRLDEQIAMLERLRERLSACIGCGCLSLKVCKIVNPDDIAGHDGSGARYVIGDSPAPRGKRGAECAGSGEPVQECKM